MNNHEIRQLLDTVWAIWPKETWPDETIAWVTAELRPWTLISAQKAVRSLAHTDRAKGWLQPSSLVAAVRDFGEPDPNAPKALPGGCDHLESHDPATLVVPTPDRVFVPRTIPADQRDEFFASVSRPQVIGGETRCLRCGQIRRCVCSECSTAHAQAAELAVEQP